MKKLLKNGPALIIIAASLWAFDGIIRRSLYILPPITIVFFEHLVGALLLLPFFFQDIKKEKITIKEFLAVFFFASLLSSLLGTLWFTTALLKSNYISFSVVYLLQKLQPIFAIVTAHLVLKEKIDRRYAKWAILALVAAYFVTFKNGLVNFQTGKETIIAALFAVGAAFAWGSSTAFSKYALINNSSRFITSLRFIITTFLALILVFIFKQQTSLMTVNISQILRFLLIALTTGMVGLLIYYKGLKITQVKISTLLELMYPFLAVVIDMVLYKSFLAPSQILAGLILLFAIYRISLLKTTK